MVGCWSENVPRPVFVETNLGTPLAAVPASPNITAMEFKREPESTHLSCFPEFGTIKVTALMVKQKSCFYHLSESLPLKCAFLDSNSRWFLRMNARLQPSSPDHMESLNCNTSEIRDPNIVTCSVKLRDPTICSDKKTIKRRRRKAPFLESALVKNPTVLCVLKSKRKRKNGKHKTEVNCTEKGKASETFQEIFSEPVSVSRIVKKYFSDDFDEVASTPFSPVNTRHERKCYSNREKHVKPEVGKRLLLAQGNLWLSSSNQQAALFLCRDRLRKSPFRKSASLVRNLVFEITSEESG